MSKFAWFVMVLVVLAMFAPMGMFAADRETFHVTELMVGPNATVVSGYDTPTLERLAGGTGTLDRVNVKTGALTGMALLHTPALAATFMDDFFNILKTTNVLESSALLVPWKYTGDAGVAADVSIGATACGMLKVISGSTDNNEAYLQHGSAGTEGAFNITSNGSKTLWFETKLTGPAAGTEAGMFVGLSEAGSSAVNFLVDNTMVADTNKSYMGFTVKAADACTNWFFQINKADNASARTLTNIVANSAARTLGFKFDGVRTVTVYADGTAISPTITINAASYPDAVNMSPIVAMKTGTASYSPTGLVDYVFIHQDR